MKTEYLIERVKTSRNTLSETLKNDLIFQGKKIVRPLTKVMPKLSSYVITAQLLEIIGEIGGDDAFKTLSLLLDDAVQDDLPQRMLSQSCIVGLASIADDKSYYRLKETLEFTNPDIRITAAEALFNLSNKRPELKDDIVKELETALQQETYEKTGLILIETLNNLGKTVSGNFKWTNKLKKTLPEKTHTPVKTSKK